MTQVRVGWRAYVSPVGGSTGTDTDAQAFITATGITDSTQISALNTLVTDLKTYGLWTKMKAIYPFVGGSAASHKWNLKDPRDLDAAYRLVFNGGWVHSSNGALPNGTTGYANTYYNPSSLLNPFIGYYSRSNTNTNTDQIDMGCSDGTKWLLLSSWYKTTTYNNILARNSSPFVLLNGGIQSDSRGWYWTNKISNVAKLGRNSNILTTADDTINPPNASIGIGAMGDSNIYVNYFSNRETAFSVIADGMSDTDTTNLYITIQKFQTTLGRHVGTPYVSDADAVAFLNAAGITDGTQAAAINTLVIRMKADGVWTKMKAIYPFVGGSAASHKWNLKDPRDLDAAYRLVFNGGWTHTSTGAKPNGTTGYYSTSLNPSNVLSTNNVSLTVYLRTDYNDPNGVVVDFGTPYYGGNVGVHIYSRSTNIMYVRANSYPMTYTNNDSLGLHGVSRLDGTNLSFIKNSIFSTTGAQSFSNSNNIIYGAYGGYGYYSPREHSFASIGDGLTSIEASNLYSAVQEFQTTLGRQVSIPKVSDIDAQAFLNTANITSFQQASAVNKLVVDLKAAGVWTKMKAIYPFVGGSAASHKFNLKDPRDLDAAYRLVFYGGMTHTNLGMVSNYTTSYADTRLTPSTALSSLFSQHVSVYSQTSAATPANNINSIGEWQDGTRSMVMKIRNLSNVFSWEVGNSSVGTTNIDGQGFYLGSVVANNSIKLYKNNANVATNTNIFSGSLPSQVQPIGKNENKTFSFSSIGDGLTDAEATAFYTAVQTYQTALGRAVNTPIYNDGLVLNLDAGNANSYTGTGTIWFDLASGNNGTLTNGPTYDTTNGGSIVFDGVNDYSGHPIINFGTSSVSWSFWIKPSRYATYESFIGQGMYPVNGGGMLYGGLRNDSGPKRIEFVICSDPNAVNSKTIIIDNAYTTNTWMNLTITYNSSTRDLFLYINGVKQSVTTNTTGNFNNTSIQQNLTPTNTTGRLLSIGMYDESRTIGVFSGNIATTQIYFRSLSDTEVLNNFNSTRGRFGL